jgi:glyoxylase-like metal-dependent hydrolase (beta-lactamase superfamily II)
MKIRNLTQGSVMYTSNVYMVRGTWNAMVDVNTLVDVGRDPEVMTEIKDARTGVGKKRVEQVILTHCHYDHSSMLQQIREEFNPTVYAFARNPGVDVLLRGGERLRMGDREFEVIHVPGHSHDSLCLYNPTDRILFSGDTAIRQEVDEGTFEADYIEGLRLLAGRPIRTVYPGHGPPITGNITKIIQRFLIKLQTNPNLHVKGGRQDVI